ncbi:hypothetical protein [Niallia taxi]|uniref:hypothetical protein n=1 Tax=Niallia taxi TaxID=2499688 RepID=UPI003D26F1DA
MVKDIIIIVALVLFVFQNALLDKIKNFSMYDELSVVFLFILTILLVCLKKSTKIRKDTLIISVISVIYFILGFLSNIIFLNQKLTYAVLDAFILFKFVLIFLFGRYIFSKVNIKSIIKIISSIAAVIAALLFILVIVNLITFTFPIYEYRYGLPAQQLFFEHPTYLVCACVLLIAFLQAGNQSKQNYKYIHLLNFVILSTLRTKGFLFVIFFYVIFFLINFLKRKITIYHIACTSILGVVLGIYLAYNSLFNAVYSPRTLITQSSFVLANQYFPLGSGFGTFGSYVSAIQYSKIYDYLNFDQYYGLSRENYSIITDTFWPMILAQTGYIGLLLFVIVLILIIIDIWRIKNRNLNYFTSAIFLIFYLLITSTSESSFANYYATGFGLYLGLLVSINYQEEINETR